MKHSKLIAALILMASAICAPAQSQGRLNVLERGKYVCALPGDATGKAWTNVPASDFTISGASSYEATSGSGTYLLAGKRLEFSRGPFKGRSFLMMDSGLLQEVDKAGVLGRMRCHRAGPVPE